LDATTGRDRPDATDPEATDPDAAEIGAVHIDSQGRPGSSRAVRKEHRRTGGLSARIWAGRLPAPPRWPGAGTYRTPIVARRGASVLPVRGQVAMIPGARGRADRVVDVPAEVIGVRDLDHEAVVRPERR
jgi:hypothetical protein